MHRIPVTVLVTTRNEAAGIEACVTALKDFDEVVVVDSNSTDDTVELARAAGASTVNFTWDGQYPKKKQWQLDHVDTRNDWVLMLDADETPTPQLIAELRALFTASSRPACDAYDVPLAYTFVGRELRFGHRVVKRALVRRGRVRFPIVDDLGLPGIGEVEGHYQPAAEGGIGLLRGRIRHRDLDPVRTWFDRHNRYSDWEAHLLERRAASRDVNRNRSRQGRLFARAPFKPLAFFVYSYVARLGFLDGRPGFDYAVALSMYYWQIGVKSRELARTAPRPT